MLRQLSRQLIFAARIPPRQMIRRAWLAGRRSVEARLKPSLPTGDIRPRAVCPEPLFDPRAGLAERVEGGWRFRFIGRAIDLRSPIDWCAPGPSSRDQLWRMNLHYMEYLEGVNDEDFGELVTGWIEANPPYDGKAMADAWTGYALSLRVVVWMQQLESRRQRLLPGLISRTERSLARQLAYLERHLETDIGGNHLIKNIKALVWGSAYFAGRRAQRWRRTAVRLLRSQLSVQMLADGMHYERSPSYHAQVLADLLEIRHAAGADPLEGALDDAMAAAAQVAADLCHPDGLVAQFGDSGLHMAYPPAELASAFQRLTGRARPPRARFSLPEAGYFGLREGDSFLVIDAGDIAPPALPAHGHSDIFSFEWSIDGQRIVVDQGVFEYAAGERRRRSRSA